MSGPRASTQTVLLSLVAGASAVAILAVENGAYPIREWLLLRVLGYWALALYFAAGSGALGLAMLEKIAPRRYRVWEVPFVAFALGVLGFAWLVFLAGLAHRLSFPFFVGAPLLCFLVGFPAARRFALRARTALGALDFRPSRLELASLALGVVGVAFVYLPILTPHNVQHDARWYHLTLAQQYAAQGFIGRFPEGWFLAAYPQLASLLYTWAMLLPLGIVHRIEVCAHLEFVIFLVTLLSVPAMVRRLLPGVRLPLSWVGFFLFPGFLAYDSNLSVGADHVAALFAPAGLLAIYPALRTLGARHALLVGALAGGATLTKYSALSVSAPLVFAVCARSAMCLRRGVHQRRALVAAGTTLAAFAVVTAPHFLKNYLWYGDPAYPILHGWFSPHPWTVQAESYHRIFLNICILSPTRDLAGVVESFKAALTLGFTTEGYGFHKDVPTFGFLFAATLYCLPFTSPPWRVKLGYAIAFFAVLVWYWTNHRDRYLQACLPWLVAATMATLHRLWTSSALAARAAAGLLVFAQGLAGAGLALAPMSFMIPEKHALPQVISLVGAGYDGNYGQRFQPYPEWNFASWTELGKWVPRGSRVLVHEDRLWLGLDAPVVVDEAAWQGGIEYGQLGTPRSVYDLLRAHGVTHVVTGQHHADGGGHGLAGDLVFFDFVFSYARPIRKEDRLALWEMPKIAPPDVGLGPSLIVTCNQSQPLGFYPQAAILRRTPEATVTATSIPDDLVARATYFVLEDDCEFPELEPRVRAAGFEKMMMRGKVSFWKRAGDSLSAAP